MMKSNPPHACPNRITEIVITVGIILNLDVINHVLFVLGYLHACGRDLESQRGMRRKNMKRLVLPSFFRS